MRRLRLRVQGRGGLLFLPIGGLSVKLAHEWV